MNKYEKNLVGYFQSFNNWSRNRRASKLKRSNGLSTPGSRQTDNTPASSIGSFRSFQLEGSTSSTGIFLHEMYFTFHLNHKYLMLFIVDLSATNELGTSQISISSQKRIKVRPALIADDDNEDGIEIVKSKPSKKSKTKPASPKIDEMGNREHLKTMKQIEDLRNEYGDGWLHCQSASKVQDVMGIIQAPVKTTPLTTTEQKLQSMFNLDMTMNASRDLTSTPIQQFRHSGFAHSPIEVSHI